MKIQTKSNLKIQTKKNLITFSAADSIKQKATRQSISSVTESVHEPAAVRTIYDSSNKTVVNGVSEADIKAALTKTELKTYKHLSSREKEVLKRKVVRHKSYKKLLAQQENVEQVEEIAKYNNKALLRKSGATNNSFKRNTSSKKTNIATIDGSTIDVNSKVKLKKTKEKVVNKYASLLKKVGTQNNITKENAIQNTEQKATTQAQKTIATVLGSIISIAGAVLLPLILFIVLLVVIVSVVVMVLGMIVWCFTPHSNLRNAYPLVGNEVLRWEYIVEDYSEKNHLSEEYIVYLLAIIAQESAGEGPDVMGIERYEKIAATSVQDSIDRGIKRFQKCVVASRFYDCDIKTAIQAYSYGEDFCKYVGENGKVFTQELSDEYARIESGGILISVDDKYIIENHGGMIYDFGNQYYLQCVKQYYEMSFDDEMYKEIEKYFDKFNGLPYVSGGSDPSMGGFDCSGLVFYIYGQVGVHIPRLEKEQFEFSKEIKKEELRPGDLVFFKNETSNGEIGHVAIYIGNGKTFEAGDPVGEYDINDSWHTENYLCAGRVLFTEDEKKEDNNESKKE